MTEIDDRVAALYGRDPADLPDRPRGGRAAR